MTGSKTIAVGLMVLLAGCQPAEQKETDDAESPSAADAAISGDKGEASYTIGYSVASNIADQFGDDFDRQAFISGLTDRFDDKDRRVSEDQGQMALATLAAKAREADQAKAAERQLAGMEFLVENGKREGVVTTDSGLQYEIIVAGDGPMPTETDTVKTHYHGTLVDGSVFDSSVSRGEPVSFPVNRVIPGWTEALQLMPVGSKWRLYIPPELAYGDRDGGPIPANSTLIFDVELLAIE